MKPIRRPSILLILLLLSACVPLANPVLPAASPGTILYQEGFEDNTSGWDRVSNENGIMDYDGGGYRMLIQKPDFNMWSTPEKNFGDVRIEADVFRQRTPHTPLPQNRHTPRAAHGFRILVKTVGSHT